MAVVSSIESQGWMIEHDCRRVWRSNQTYCQRGAVQDVYPHQFVNNLMVIEKLKTFGCWSHILPLGVWVGGPMARIVRIIHQSAFS